MKILAVDYGEKRIGLALGDTESKLALPYGVLERQADELVLERLQQILLAEDIGLVVVGEPVTLGHKASQQTQTTRAFADFLKAHLAIPVALCDERFTSQRADAAMRGAGAPTRSRDELAAMFILQDYLERPTLKD